jgi:hypothetical protein
MARRCDQRRACQPAPGRPCAGLGAGARRTRRPGLGGLGRLLRQRRRDDANPSCAAFEPVRCDCFITESTFGLPVYRWRPQAEVMARSTPGGRPTPTPAAPACCWPTASARRSACWPGVDAGIGPIVVHDAVDAINSRLPRRRRGAAAHAAPGRGEGQGSCCAARWCMAPPRCAWVVPGPRRWATAATPSPAAGCSCAARAAARAWTAASRSATMPTGRACRRHRRHRRQPRDRHPRLRGGDGALAAAAGPAGRQLTVRVRRTVCPPRGPLRCLRHRIRAG